MPATEFLSWRVFYNKRPFGDRLIDLIQARLMAQQEAIWSKGKKKRMDVKKFMFNFEPRRSRVQTTEQMELALRTQFLAMGGDPNMLN